MPTGQTVITNTLTKLNVCDQNGSPSASDSAYALSELNNMWSAWSIDEGLIYAELPFSGNLVTATASYTIGTGATFNTQRPARIYKAFFVLGANRNELKIVEAGAYFEHNDLTAAAATPDELYPDYNVDASGYAKLYLWPVPTFLTGSPQLQILQAVAFSTWALAVNYNIPDAYQDAIEWALAFRLLPGFGQIVDPRTAEVAQAEGLKAEARLREMNARNRQLPADAVMSPGSKSPQKAA